MTLLDIDLIQRICTDSSKQVGSEHRLRAAVIDPLDGNGWVSMSSPPAAEAARRALHAHGLDAHDLPDNRIRVVGWDSRLLRHRLGVLLAGVDDLTTEWDATAELVRYHYDRRIDGVCEPDLSDVLADVEAVMRTCQPIPHRAPSIEDVDRLRELIEAAEDAYQRLIAEHLDFAEHVLSSHIATRDAPAPGAGPSAD